MEEEIIYIESEDMKKLAHDLRQAYYVHLGHVNLDAIFFVEKDGILPKKAKTIEIAGVTNGGIRLLMQKIGGNQNYCVSVWKESWDAINEYQRQWLMFEILYSIKYGSEGYLRKPDVQEYGPIIEYFANTNIGVHWRKCEELPNLLDTISLPIPLPPDEDEESAGSTI
jgi:hypothetical protein